MFSLLQTPLMLAAMRGELSAVDLLLERGANILMFDSVNGWTPLHFAAYYGHLSCLQLILSAAASCNDISVSWGFSRFVNARDQKGKTPLHLASRKRHPDCVHLLLENGALVSASTGGYGVPGSTPLHLAAQGGSVNCIRELLAWGADRNKKDEAGRIPYVVALNYRQGACLGLLDPSSAEPLVWPSPLKFINELQQDAKFLLEQALMAANKEREKTPSRGTNSNNPSLSQSGIAVDDNDSELGDNETCGICFEKACTIEVQDCGHQMCAQCTLILCCHNKPNPTNTHPTAPTPVCPFCRSDISRLVVAKLKSSKDSEQSGIISEASLSPRKSRRSWSSIGGLHSGRIAADMNWVDKTSAA
uniref:RING-type E3 ubiquitin transferase n=1 Tax=Kalanchoe fedtschenkoi TaxID=63787 RepID=A0A7N0UKK6_KALFE